jgi:hypothetical protein
LVGQDGIITLTGLVNDPVTGSYVDTTPSYQGQAAPGSKVDLIVDGEVEASYVVGEDGTYVLTVTNPLAPGDHVIEVKVTPPAQAAAQQVAEAVSDAAQATVSAIFRTDATLKDTPLLNAAGSLAEAILPQAVSDTLAPAAEAIKDSVVAIRESPAVQTVNSAIATPAAAAAMTVTTASAVGGIAGFQQFGLFLFTQGSLLFRRKKRYGFGVVYSHGSKLPVDLAIVRLVDQKTGRPLATRVTDKQGRYLFIAPPGEFKLEVRKDGFSFPSPSIPQTPSDGPWTDLYFGQTLTLPEGGVIAKNVPLDPVSDQRLHQEVMSGALKAKAQWSLAALGPGLAAASYLATPRTPQILALLFHLSLLYVFHRLTKGKKPKNWGKVSDEQGKPLKHAVVRIVETQYNKVLESQLTDDQGRYSFLAGQNVYYLRFEKPGYATAESQPLDFREVKEATVAAVDVNMRKV